MSRYPQMEKAWNSGESFQSAKTPQKAHRRLIQEVSKEARVIFRNVTKTRTQMQNNTGEQTGFKAV